MNTPGTPAPRPPPDRASFDREAIRRKGLREYIKRAWSQVEPSTYSDNWHTHAIAEHLEACYRGEIKRLIINVPPGSGKSLTASVFFPTWVWAQDPPLPGTEGAKTRFHFLSYDARLSLRDAIRSRDLVNSTWYQERWGGAGGVNIPHQVQRAAALYKNNKGGMRLTVTLQGGSTGHHAHIQLVDDPIKPKDTQGNADQTRTILKKVEDLWSGTLATRIADPKYFIRIIVMQRLHDADLCGTELSNGGYTHLMIPLRYEPARAKTTSIGWSDPRKAAGELMWPSRTNEEAAKQLEHDLAQFASAQLQQDPVPSIGGIFESAWFDQFWSPNGEIPGTVALPSWPEMSTLQSWDMTFKGNADSDRVCGQTWGRKGARFFLIDQILGRYTYTQTKEKVIAFTERYPRVLRKLVEDKANGSAILDDLQYDVPGLEPVDPEGGKESRANAVAPLYKARNVILPHPSLPGMGWVKDYITEHTRFPKAPNDDQVDASSQALSRLYTKTPKMIEAMAEYRREREAEAAARALPSTTPAVILEDAPHPATLATGPSFAAVMAARARGGLVT